jgi:hypothetical protein
MSNQPPQRLTHELTAHVSTLLRSRGLTPLVEFRLPNARRLDVAALISPRALLGVEVKISVRDLMRDLKWSDYLNWCAYFYFAVPRGFPWARIGDHAGVMICDPTGVEIIRPAPFISWARAPKPQ